MSLILPEATPVLGGVLGVSALAVWRSGRREFLLRWLSFFAATPVLVLAASFGSCGALVLALAIGIVCTWEYGRLVGLDRWTSGVLLIGVLAVVACAAAHRTFPMAALLLVGVGVPILRARAEDGLRQAALVTWGVLWLGTSLAALPELGARLLPLAAAVSVADVAAYFGGSFADRHGDRRPVIALRLSRLSPNKTWAGVGTGTIAGIVTLAVLGDLTVVGAVAVTVGGVLGDLIESLVKRCCGVKDAGRWLPGFGGLLDRVDSLLGALLVIAVLT